jgi:peptidoglycan hydrolase-like protein with peptidoglycan-binding domain
VTGRRRGLTSIRVGAAPVVAGLVLALTGQATAGLTRDADVAALQVGLRGAGLYDGDIDGLAGSLTAAALRRLKGATAPLSGDTREALGVYGAPTLGSRPLAGGCTGWDVAALQFELAWHGFASGTFDGVFGPATEAALVRFQRWAGVPAIGIAGPLTLAALRTRPPVSPVHLAMPIAAAPGDEFGPRGARFHAGIDFPAPFGTTVEAAGPATVVAAGWRAGGFGNAVELDHGGGVTTLYAHMSAVLVKPGQRVETGTAVGLVGDTGHATGPHLHFEVHVRGAAVDPATALDLP